MRYGSLAEPHPQRLTTVVEALGEVEGDDAVRVPDDHALAVGQAREQVETEAARLHVPPDDRQPQLAELKHKTALRLFGLRELLEGHGVVGVGLGAGEPAREAAAGGGVLAHEPVALPATVRAGVPGLPVDDDATVSQAVELLGEQLIPELRLALRAGQGVEVDEVPAVGAPGL